MPIISINTKNLKKSQINNVNKIIYFNYTKKTIILITILN